MYQNLELLVNRPSRMLGVILERFIGDDAGSTLMHTGPSLPGSDAEETRIFYCMYCFHKLTRSRLLL
jgi:hypothetical protein